MTDQKKETPQPQALQLIEKYKKEIQAALPNGMGVDRIISVVRGEVRNNTKLLECAPATILGCVIDSCQLGLEPNKLLGYSYLVPFYNKDRQRKECQLIIGYQGVCELARRSGDVAKVDARVVLENDFFDYSYGLREKLDHIPAKGDRGKFVCAYAVITLKNGAQHFEVMSQEEINKIRDRKKSPEYGPWITDYLEMCKKTVLKRALKLTSRSIELSKALADDENVIECEDPYLNNLLTDEIAAKVKSKSDQLLDQLTERTQGGEHVD